MDKPIVCGAHSACVACSYWGSAACSTRNRKICNILCRNTIWRHFQLILIVHHIAHSVHQVKQTQYLQTWRLLPLQLTEMTSFKVEIRTEDSKQQLSDGNCTAGTQEKACIKVDPGWGIWGKCLPPPIPHLVEEPVILLIKITTKLCQAKRLTTIYTFY